MNLAEQMLKKLNDSNLSDHVVPNGESINDNAGTKKLGKAIMDNNENVEVVVRKVVTKEQQNDNICIEAENDIVEVGNKVKEGEIVASDGIYSFDSEEGEVSFLVKGGIIAAIGDEAISDLTKTVVRNGVVRKVTVRTVKKRLSSAQRQALVKARKKANTGSAKKARLKSFMKGMAKGIYKKKQMNSADPSYFDISGVDMKDLGDKLYERIFKALADRYELTEELITKVEEMIGDEVCTPVVNGNKLTFIVPVWTEMNDELDLEKFDLAELVYELQGEHDSDSISAILLEGEMSIETSLVI